MSRLYPDSSSQVQLSAPVSLTRRGTSERPACFLEAILSPRRPPSLRWVPLGGVSQLRRYYLALRLPRAHALRLMDSPSSSSTTWHWERADLTGSWDAHPARLPCSLTPAGPDGTPVCRFGAAPVATKT